LYVWSKSSTSLSLRRSREIDGTSTMVLYGPLNSLSPSTWNGLISRESRVGSLLQLGLHMSPRYCGETTLVEENEDVGDDDAR
jgi:hypothetical protein